MKKQYNQPSLVLTTMATANFCNYSIEGQRLYTGDVADKGAPKVDQSGNNVDDILGDDQWASQW